METFLGGILILAGMVAVALFYEKYKLIIKEVVGRLLFLGLALLFGAITWFAVKGSIAIGNPVGVALSIAAPGAITLFCLYLLFSKDRFG